MLGVGVIGAGRVAQIAHLPAFAAQPGVRLAALADLRPQLRAAVGERFAIPALYGSHHDLLADPGVEAVVVVTQRSQTAAIVADALRAGKHVLSEKPMAQSVAEGRELVALADRMALRYAVGYMKRHDPGVAAARALLAEWRSGAYGELVAVRATMDSAEDRALATLMTEEPRADLGFTPVAPAGVATDRAAAHERFLNVFSHTTNLVRYLAGGPLAVRAAVVERVGAASILAGAGDVPVVFSLHDRPTGGWREFVDVLFERARVRLILPAPFDRAASARVHVQAGERVWDLAGEGWAFVEQARSFVEDIRTGREPVASGRDALDDLAFAEALWRPSGGRAACR